MGNLTKYIYKNDAIGVGIGMAAIAIANEERDNANSFCYAKIFCPCQGEPAKITDENTAAESKCFNKGRMGNKTEQKAGKSRG